MKAKFKIKYCKTPMDNDGMVFYIEKPHIGYIGWFGNVETSRSGYGR